MIESIRLYFKLHPKVRVFALLMGIALVSAFVGGILPDLDHTISGQARTWGHNAVFPIAVSLCVVFSYYGRLLGISVLKRRKNEKT